MDIFGLCIDDLMSFLMLRVEKAKKKKWVKYKYLLFKLENL